MKSKLLIGGAFMVLVLGSIGSIQGAPPPRACSDHVDNDGDGLVDYPADPGCENRNDRDEFNAPIPPPPPPPPSGGNGDDLAFPIRAAFYYPWYSGNWFDKPGCNLSIAFSCASPHMPAQGYYSQSYSKARYDIDNMQRARIETGISSWFGPGHRTDTNLPDMLRAALDDGGGFQWAIYYEEGDAGYDPSATTIRSHLDYVRANYASHPNYLSKNDKPVVFVYFNGGSCASVARWAQATDNFTTWYVSPQVFSGYLNCASKPSSWHQYGVSFSTGTDRQPGFSHTIEPEFWHWSAPSPLMPRDLARFKSNVRAQVASSEPWQLTISYNEWGEGTSIEPGTHKTQGAWGNLYLDALATNGN